MHAVCHIGEDAAAIDGDVGLEVRHLVGRENAAFDVDVDARHVGGMVCQPIHAHDHIAAIGSPFVGVLGGRDECRFAAREGGHLIDSQFGHTEVVLVGCLRLHEANQVVRSAKVNDGRGVGSANACGQTVLESGYVGPVDAVRAHLNHQFLRITLRVGTSHIGELQLCQRLGQPYFNVGIFVQRQFLVVARSPCGMEEGLRISVEHHAQVFAIGIVGRRIGRQHLGRQVDALLFLIVARLGPHLVLHFAEGEDALARTAESIDDVLVEAQARDLALLLRAIHEGEGVGLVQLEGSRQSLADGSHLHADGVALANRGDDIGGQLVVVFVVELVGSEARQRTRCFALYGSDGR